MGRVRRYKKVKAIDPFAKRVNKRDLDTIHDEPPQLFAERRSKLKYHQKFFYYRDIFRIS